MSAVNIKYIISLLMLTIGQQAYPHKHELKIYRKPKRLSFMAGVAAELLSLGALKTAQSISDETVHKRGRLVGDELMVVNRLKMLGTTGVAVSSLYILSFLSWWAVKLNKPILIFDEEGFTYEKPMGWFRGRNDVRYLWKDVVSHWSEGVVNHWGRELKKTWCYHINGEKKVLKINVLELDIPNEILAKVESLRQGRVRALWCD